MDLLTMSVDERATHFAGLDDAALTAAITDLSGQRETLLATPDADLTVATVDKAKATVAALKQAREVQTERTTAATNARKEFDALRASVNDGVETGDEDPEAVGSAEQAEETTGDGEDEGEGDGEDEGEGEGDEEVEAAKGENPFPPKKKDDEEEESDEDKRKRLSEEAALTASARRGATKVPAARKVARSQPKRPAKTAPSVIITAAADVPDFAMGQRMTGMNEVATAVENRVSNFPPFNAEVAQAIQDSTGLKEDLRKFSTASIHTPFPETMTAAIGSSPGQENEAMKAAVKAHERVMVASMDGVGQGADKRFDKETMVAAGMCAPSEVVYTYTADYVVDGIATFPEVAAPRGGLMTTLGPRLAEQYAQDGSDFGFTQTEAQMEAGVEKTCETIICPPFEDHRLDAAGYCWKIPFMTEKFYPELVKDAMSLSSVLWAHKMNSRFIKNALDLSTLVVAKGLGGSFDDTLEALAILAHKERRRFNLGENAVMEVKMPSWVKEVFKAEMGRRVNRPAGAITDAQINAEFSARRLATEYTTDWAELTGLNPVFPETFPVMVYPTGTFVKSVNPVVRLSSVYDAASIVQNEYTGVFFEQAQMLFKQAYDSRKFVIPICTAGLVGAPILDCHSETTNFAGQDNGVRTI